MNIQIFGISKCFDTKKAERYFKERRIPFQRIDLKKFGMSGGEFDAVVRALGGIDQLIDWEKKDPEIEPPALSGRPPRQGGSTSLNESR